MIVLALGSFDLLHVGHLELLRGCRELAGPAGRVIVALNRDAFIERYKGRLPALPFHQRRQLLEAIADVDAVVCNSGDEDSRLAIEVVLPDVLAIGSDWFDPEAADPEARYFAQLGVTRGWMTIKGLEVRYIDRTTGQSTSGIRGRLE